MSNKDILIKLLESFNTISICYGVIRNDDINSLLNDFEIKKGNISHDSDYVYYFDNGFDKGVDASFITDNPDVILIEKNNKKDMCKTICYLLKING